jgi:hypothetical protein
MNKAVQLSPEAQARVPHGAELDALTQIDYAYVLAHRAEWTDRFQKEIISGN